MTDQLKDRARKAAEEIYAWPRHWPQEREYRIITDEERLSAYAAIIERNMREANKENHTHPNDFEPMAFASWRNGND